MCTSTNDLALILSAPPSRRIPRNLTQLGLSALSAERFSYHPDRPPQAGSPRGSAGLARRTHPETRGGNKRCERDGLKEASAAARMVAMRYGYRPVSTTIPVPRSANPCMPTPRRRPSASSTGCWPILAKP